jgi:hypothetical protein
MAGRTMTLRELGTLLAEGLACAGFFGVLIFWLAILSA